MPAGDLYGWSTAGPASHTYVHEEDAASIRARARWLLTADPVRLACSRWPKRSGGRRARYRRSLPLPAEHRFGAQLEIEEPAAPLCLGANGRGKSGSGKMNVSYRSGMAPASLAMLPVDGPRAHCVYTCQFHGQFRDAPEAGVRRGIL
ncbi:hypothetical protein MRX96_041335 [Rhipicephalus microplus]